MSVDDYAVEQVTDRVFRIPLPLPLDDHHIVNATSSKPDAQPASP